MALELINRKNRLRTKKQCVGCKYDRYENWIISDKDHCFDCDSNGSERVQDNTRYATTE